tara:strand:- start:14 stop:148 length:135 start_codon:yes stop_codon:yes gene_type:complete
MTAMKTTTALVSFADTELLRMQGSIGCYYPAKRKDVRRKQAVVL